MKGWWGSEIIAEFGRADLSADCRADEDGYPGRQAERGEYLPSIRGLAKDLKISVITTMKAYELLETEGLVTAAQGKGFYVNAQDSEMLREQHLRRVEEALQQAISAAEIAGMTDEELQGTLQTLLRMKES